MVNCEQCGTEILRKTDAAEKGKRTCIPCTENRSLFDDFSRNVRNFQKRLDGQRIQLTQITQTKLHADFEVTSTLWDIDPRFRSCNIRVGTASAILRLKRDAGAITVIYPMAFDKNGQILLKAKRVLFKAFERGEFPEKTATHQVRPHKLPHLTQRSTFLFVRSPRSFSPKNSLQPLRKWARRYLNVHHG